MDADYWHRKWASGDIKFHQTAFNALMVKYAPALGIGAGGRVFVPLCGKTRDIAWLLAQGYRVVGAELNRDAVAALFRDLDVVPEVSEVGALTLFAADGLDVFVGDVFDLTQAVVGSVDAVFDRAALVALPDPVRAKYAAHVIAVTHGAPQLLLTFTYDQDAMSGPPFSVTDQMVRTYYAGDYTVEALETVDVPGAGLKGRVPAVETAWLLS